MTCRTTHDTECETNEQESETKKKVEEEQNNKKNQPTHLESKRYHDPVLSTPVRHPRMPGPQVSDHHVAFLAQWLHRWPHFPPRLHDLGVYVARGISADDLIPHTCGFCARNLVCGGGVRV